MAEELRHPENGDLSLEGELFGHPSLYWTFRDGHVSTARHPADLAGQNARPCASALAALIASIDPPPTSSFFEDIHHVPNDSTVTVHPTGTFDVRPHHLQVDACCATPIEAANEIWRRTVASVKRSIGDAKHVAVATGGGVDSSALLVAAVAIARGASRSEVSAVTLHFGGEGDDRPFMRELEQELGIVSMRIDPVECAPNMRHQMDDPRMPMWTPTAPTDFELPRRAAELGADVMLMGIGGDDLFEGYPRLFANDFFAHPLETALQVQRLQGRRGSFARMADFIARPLAARIMPASVRQSRRVSLHRSRFPWAGPQLRTALETDAAAWRPARLDTPTERFDFLAKAQFLPQSLELMDEFARRTNIRVAHPYLDRDLLELTASLPPAMLMHGHRFRGLFRLAVRGILPEKVRLRPDKASFAEPRRQMFAAAGGIGPFRDLATMTECEKLGLVDARLFRNAFESFEREAEANDILWNWVWPAMAVEAFLRARAQHMNT